MVKSLLVPFILWSAVAFCSNIVIDILSQRISIGDIIRTQFIDIFVYARLVWFLLILFIVDIIYIIVYAAGIVWLVYFISKYFCVKCNIFIIFFGKKIKINIHGNIMGKREENYESRNFSRRIRYPNQ